MAGVIVEPRTMRGGYLPFNDGCGIVGYSYECPRCGLSNSFTDCETGCECGFSEPYVDPDDWYAERMARAKAMQAWGDVLTLASADEVVVPDRFIETEASPDAHSVDSALLAFIA